MYCTNCGAVNPDGTKFCTVCGAALAPETPEAKPNALKKLNLSKNKLIAIIAAAVVVIALIVVIAVAAKSAKPAYLKAALQYVDDLLSLDAERTAKACWPEPFWDYYEDNWDDWDIEDMIEECADGIDYATENFFDEYDIDLKKLYKAVKVKMTDATEIKKGKVKDMNKFLEEEMDMDDHTISEAWLVKLKVFLTWKDRNLDKKFDKNKTCAVLVVKIDGKWYAVDSAISSKRLNYYANREEQYFNNALDHLVDRLTDKLD